MFYIVIGVSMLAAMALGLCLTLRTNKRIEQEEKGS